MICDVCGSHVSRSDALIRHRRFVHGMESTFRINCPDCEETFSRSDNMETHRRRFHGNASRKAGKSSSANKQFSSDNTCRGKKFKVWRPWEDTNGDNCRTIHTHAADPNLDSELLDISPQSTPPDHHRDEPLSHNAHEGTPLAQLDRGIQELIKKNYTQIKTNFKISNRVQDRFNFQTCNPKKCDIQEFLGEIYQRSRVSFKINASLGFVLRHIQTGELVYYYASNNNKLLPRPTTIINKTDLKKFANLFLGEDLLDYCRKQRPNTRYIVESITNVLFYVDKLKEFPIGGRAVLPDYVKLNRGVISLEKNSHGIRYNDQKCLFRCLAMHRQTHEHRLESEANNLQSTWLNYIRITRNQFKGITLSQLSTFEDCFRINVEVFALVREVGEEEDEEVGVCVKKLFSSRLHYEGQQLRVNLYEDHFSYIKSFGLYARRWQCRKCEKLFSRYSRLTCHEKSCTDATVHRFDGGGYGPSSTIFTELEQIGVHVPVDKRFYPFITAIDFEAMIVPLAADQQIQKGLTKHLRPVSVSICSNVPQFTSPHCIIRSEENQNMCEDLIDRLVRISDYAYSLMQIEFSAILQQIQTRITQIQDHVEQETDGAKKSEHEYKVRSFAKLLEKLHRWLRQTVVLGFNSAKFDINLIRSQLFPLFLSKGMHIENIIKKGNAYVCVSFERWIFLDIRNYVSANVSYRSWLESYEVDLKKGFFPYEWLDDIEKLNQRQLPPRSSFWSTLKQEGIAVQDYEWLQRVWYEQGFNTMADMLAWYNNLDVLPFIKAAEKMMMQWRKLNIDPFKGGAISLPGLAFTHLVNRLPKHTILPLIPERFKDLHYMIHDNVVGGLSIVMHRYHEVGKTVLPNGRLCKSIVSRDANSLYLASLADETGTGLMVVWRPTIDNSVSVRTSTDAGYEEKLLWEEQRARNLETTFKRQVSCDYSFKELQWLEWMSSQTEERIQHKFNGGQKVFRRTSKIAYPVDGFISKTNTVLQFHGCFWHAHDCTLGQGQNPQRREATEAITAYLRAAGCTVIEKWECEWDAEVKQSTRIRHFIRTHLEIAEIKKNPTGDELLIQIKKHEIFGLVECDIEVPMYRSDLVNYFKEYPPIFKNVNISVDDIDDLMKDYAVRNDQLSQPRRCLINSYFGHKILLSTSLVNWYLSHGLVVTRIYQVIQMKPKKCFEGLRDEVAQKRREADDTDRKIEGMMWKDVGNNYYGKAYTNKEKHKNISIVTDHSAARFVNNKRFSEMEEVGDSAYEVVMDKRVIKFDLPVTVAVFVYMNSKLRMLKFVYDFLQYYLRPGSYQLVCSDTDSIIAAYEDESIDNLIRPDRREEFCAKGKEEYLVTDKFSERTPGLFKIEWEGDGIIALCAKTYYFWKKNGDAKISCKGLSKQTNAFTKENFFHVLETGQRGGGTNHGFKILGKGMYQYRQDRLGLSYLYVKREVMSDGISTKPLLL